MFSLPDRIIGVETEFGCYVDEELGEPEAWVQKIKDHVFYELKWGLLDRMSRDEVFEPALSGGFLINGARLYVDAVGDHLEYATAECRKLRDVIAQDRAGHRLILRAIRELGVEGRVKIYNNSVDHFYGHTFGCHENYLVRMTDDFFSDQLPLVYSFLATRQIFAGAGRVGGHKLIGGARRSRSEMEAHPQDYIWVSSVYDAIPDDSVGFQLSQRADHILKPVASRVRFNRAMINPKWEHFYSHERLQRLHVLFGEANMHEFAYALKLGSTAMVLRLLEDGHLDGDAMYCLDPVGALREVARDLSFKTPIEMLDGAIENPLSVQRFFLEQCQRYAGETEDIDWTLKAWAETLDQLEEDPMQLGDRLDWVAKYKMVQLYQEAEGVGPLDDALFSVDLEYHNIDPDQSLFTACAQEFGEQRIADELAIIESISDPPADTRALGRSKAIHRILKDRKARYVVDWNAVVCAHKFALELNDPYETYETALDEISE